jgi:hypothetical protein
MMSTIDTLKLALEALEKCREGFEMTRQYVGYETLPATEGWSWYDGDVSAKEAITAIKQALLTATPLADSALDRMAENARELGLDYELAPVQEPVGYLFQHEETGLTMVVDVQQVEWGFEKNNPRHQKIGPVYTTPPVAQRQWVEVEQIKWDGDKLIAKLKEST